MQRLGQSSAAVHLQLPARLLLQCPALLDKLAINRVRFPPNP